MTGQRWYGHKAASGAAAPGIRQMAWGYASSNAASVTLQLGQAPTPGNILVVWVAALTSGTLAAPAGWTLVDSVTAAQPGQPAGNNCNLIALIRTAQSGDTRDFAFSLPAGGSAGYAAFALGYELEGVTTTVYSHTTTTGSNGTMPTPSIGSTPTGLFLSCELWFGDNTQALQNPLISQSASSPGGGWFACPAYVGLYGQAAMVSRLCEGGAMVCSWNYVAVNSSNPDGCAQAMVLEAA